MAYTEYYEEIGFPMKGKKLEEVKEFLGKKDLDYDEGVEFTVNLRDKNRNIVASGSLEDNILKCIAVSDSHQGEGLSSKVVTRLISQAFENGHSHLFVFTKPNNTCVFRDLAFHMISKTKDAALLENKKNGISDYVNSLKPKAGAYNEDDVAAIIVNCNPFTKGHLYLIEKAAKACSLLHILVVSEDKSVFPADIRLSLVKEGLAHLDNVMVHPTSNYLISSATFPTYFIKDEFKEGQVNTILDLTIFLDYFVEILNIKKRFVGTEPYDKVTAAYNEQMKSFLGENGVEVIEVPRYEIGDQAVSASRVRRLMAQGDYETIKEIVPPTTYDFLISEKGKEIAEIIRKEQKN